ncbi:SurA N-terminal domain-containing protein [Anaerofustis sp.]|uniref:peptidylprolyl isomerase n=1 Tax=Anaerofustis sp. TaxID=1872517 RepID=UPI0025C55CD2|nr:SurA N-terminal domain-containing protein [Anaerofustis sp.]
MRNLKKILGITLIFALCLSMFGCTVNEEKLKEKAVAKVNDNIIQKKDLDNMVGFTLVSYYATSGTAVDTSDATVESLKEQAVEDLVQNELVKTVASKYGYKVNQKDIDKAISTTLKSIKDSSYMKGDNYLSTLNKYGFKDEKSFKEAVKLYAESSTYLQGFTEQFRKSIQGKEYATSTYMTVGDLKVPSYIYYYCFIQKTLEDQYNSYLGSYTGETQSESKSVEELKEESNTMLEEKAAYYSAGKDAKTQISKKQISNKISENSTYESMFGSQTMESICEAYGITKTQYDKAAKWVATADVYKDQLSDNVKYDKPTESEAEKEFNKNTEQYDKSTVSAKHILTQDKSLAKEIYEQSTKEDVNFDDIMSKYQNNSSVEQASDLGAFTYASMVEDFSKAVFKADKGEVIGPVKTEYGYHVVYVYDKNITQPVFKDYKDTVLSTLDAKKKEEAAIKLNEDILKEHKCKILIEDIDEPYNMLISKLKKDNKVKIYKSIMNK